MKNTSAAKFHFLATALLFVAMLGQSTAKTPEPDIKSLADKKIVFLGDSITQAGQYVSFTSYYLESLYPEKNFDIYPLGLASETLSGLSEDGHAGGRFPRPCVFERLARVLDKVKPDVIFACYGINDGIYLPLDDQRFAAFKDGVQNLISQSKAAGVQQIYLITPPIYDVTTKPGEFNYDSVMSAYAAWEMSINEPGVQVIDLHSPMRIARDARTEAFSNDRVHPGEDGHLFMAQTILKGLGLKIPESDLATIKANPLFKSTDALRRHRANTWMRHIGYTREKTVSPQVLEGTDEETKLRDKINTLRRK